MPGMYGKVGRKIPVTLLEVGGCSITTLAVVGLYMLDHPQHHARVLRSHKRFIDCDDRIS